MSAQSTTSSGSNRAGAQMVHTTAWSLFGAEGRPKLPIMCPLRGTLERTCVAKEATWNTIHLLSNGVRLVHFLV